MNIKKKLKENPLTKDLYRVLKKQKDVYKYRKDFFFIDKYENRSQGYDKLCIVLAGYKEFAYNGVFSRIKKYMIPDMDVCVVSSGIYSDRLSEICKINGWSYLSTKRNNVCLAQNIAIKINKKAKYIFKLDEDIFITEGYFVNMLRAYEHAKTGDYIPGVMAPLLLVNGYAHLRILDKLGLRDVYKDRFESPKYAAGQERKIENDVNAAKFMWGITGEVPSLDDLNKMFSAEPLEERACAVRFSIGAILFERRLWRDMGYFKISGNGADMGADEGQICQHCCCNSRPIMVSENIVVGHLSFGKQNEEMKKYYIEHEEYFSLKNK